MSRAALVTLATLTVLALVVFVFAVDAWGDEYANDARLVDPTAWTRYNEPCSGLPTFSRVLVLTRRGGSLGAPHVRHNGDLVWRLPSGVVKLSRGHTIVNHARRTILFVAFCNF